MCAERRAHAPLHGQPCSPARRAAPQRAVQDGCGWPATALAATRVEDRTPPSPAPKPSRSAQRTAPRARSPVRCGARSTCTSPSATSATGCASASRRPRRCASALHRALACGSRACARPACWRRRAHVHACALRRARSGRGTRRAAPAAAGRARACACMRRAMPQRSRAWREAGRGAERAQRARCDLCRGRRSKTGTRRSASCTRSTGWLGARCSSRSWPTSTPPPSALAWRRAPARAPPGPLDERRCRRARSRRAGRADSSAPVLRRPGLSFAVEAVPGTLAAAARRRCVAMGHRLRSSATLFSACMAARRRRARAEAPPRARQGCEALIPGMKALIDRSAESGVESICIGMPHRGARPLGMRRRRGGRSRARVGHSCRCEALTRARSACAVRSRRPRGAPEPVRSGCPAASGGPGPAARPGADTLLV